MIAAWGGPQVLLGTVPIAEVDRIVAFDIDVPNRKRIARRMGGLGLGDKAVLLSEYKDLLFADEAFAERVALEVDHHGKGASYHPIVNGTINSLSEVSTW